MRERPADDELAGVGYKQSFGLWLRQVRQHKRMSLDVVAEKSGLTKPSVWAIERGASVPSLATATRISNALGVPLSKVLAWMEQE